MREKKGIRLAAGLARRHAVGVRRNQCEIALCIRHPAGIGVADHALRDPGRLESGDLGQGAHHQLLRHAHAKAAGNQLVERKAAIPVELRPPVFERLDADLGGRSPQGQQTFIHPLRQTDRLAGLRLGQQMSDGFSQVANAGIALIDQPLGQTTRLSHRLAKRSRRHDLARLAACQEVGRPGGVSGRCVTQIAHHRLDLVRGRSGGIEVGIEPGEGLHARGAAGVVRPSTSLSSPSNWVGRAPASMPCSPSHRTMTATCPWVTKTRCARLSPIACCSPGQSA